MFEEQKFGKTNKTLRERVSPERKEWVRKESALILARSIMLREEAKQNMFEERAIRDERLIRNRMKIAEKWNKRLTNSPFNVDLVAEDERIYEENRIRSEEQARLRKQVYERKEKAKNDIILKALAEFSDLEALRREKRAIIEEEQRLKALLTLEKANKNAKADRLAAERAERQRLIAKLAHRREVYKDSLDTVIDEEAYALKKKHGLDRPDKQPVGIQISTNPNSASLHLITNNTNTTSSSNTRNSTAKSRK
eukprot:TRINITY_DN98811_c0_g1_i1.p1 TRINITY_DN98811_c0_g1~~TRINITY_DN98811_c0_g1_i1.p1  ORF type:complete len:253 (-),score=2.32 TRINITY_DN98811_c0_g1_i1:13-771(-)